MVPGITWLWVGLEIVLEFLNLDCLLDFYFEGGIILYGECLMVFGLCDLSVDPHLEGKNIQQSKS